MDSALAYEKNAQAFLRGRDRSPIGTVIVRRWADSLPKGADVIEIACGGGYPITRELVDAGLQLWALDSSPTLISVFRSRFPGIPIQCEKIQDSKLFARTFDAAIAVGLLFLLPEAEQVAVIAKIANALVPGGRCLLMAPTQEGTWQGMNTGIACLSLGQQRYEEILAASDLHLLTSYEDVGKNNYYDVEKFNSKGT